MRIVTNSADETKCLAASLASVLTPATYIRLEGALGAGKTTFTQGLGRALGIERAIKSPTYTIIKTYDTPNFPLVHVDAYRLEEGGADTVDLEIYEEEGAVIMMEWAQFMEEALPDSYLQLTFHYQEESNQRLIVAEIIGENAAYLALVSRWMEAFNR